MSDRPIKELLSGDVVCLDAQLFYRLTLAYLTAIKAFSGNNEHIAKRLMTTSLTEADRIIATVPHEELVSKTNEMLDLILQIRKENAG